MEIIRFEIPGSASTLFVSGLPGGMEREDKWKALYEAFSKHGLLYEVQLPSDSQSVDYGFIRYYSHCSASRAVREFHKKLVIGEKLIRVAFSSAVSKYANVSRVLHVTKCHQLMNYYLGFNGWSIEMEEWEKSAAGTSGGVAYSCRASLTVRGWRVTCQGKASLEVTEDTLDTRAKTVKQCYQKACEQAFSSLVLVVSPNANVHVHSLQDSQQNNIMS